MKHPKFKITNQNFIALTTLGFTLIIFISLKILVTENPTSYNLTFPNNSPQANNREEQQPNRFNIPILMYHHVGDLPDNPNDLRKNLTVSPENFELHMAWLKSQGHNTIHLNDILKHVEKSMVLPTKPIVLTFDDGYLDALGNTLPILKKYNFKATFAIITQFPGIKLGDNEYADWEQISQAQKAGMEIVSHTQDHFDGTNPKYSKDFILRNLISSQTDIKNHLGESLPILVYPFGHYNENYLNLAKQAGYKIGITTQAGKLVDLENLMEIPRVRIHGGGSLEIFKKTVLK